MPYFYVKAQKNIDICNFLNGYYCHFYGVRELFQCPLKRGGLVCLPRERTMIRRNKSVSIGGIWGRIKLIISGSMYLKICEMLGGVGEKIYLCIINV